MYAKLYVMNSNTYYETFKRYMLSAQIAIDNIYLDSYIKLILGNLGVKKKKSKTQAHHIIPKYCFRAHRKKIINNNNIVNLLYKDHILAHYYLSLCSASEYYKFSNISALGYLLGRNKVLLTDNAFLQELPKLQCLYEYYNSNKKVFISMKGINKTKVWMNNGLQNIRVLPETIEDFKKQGFEEGCIHNSTIGKKLWVTDDLTEKLIEAIHKNNFLADNPSYHLGRKAMHYKSDVWVNRRGHVSNTKDKISIHRDGINKFIYRTDLKTYLSEGWVKGLIVHKKPFRQSSEARDKMKQAQQNRIWIHKNTINKKIKKSELSQYLKEGYLEGRYVVDSSIFKNKQPHIWITKDGENKRVTADIMPSYIENGWHKGRDISKIISKKLENNKPSKKGINSGGKYIVKDNIKKHVYGADINYYLENGWRLLKDAKR